MDTARRGNYESGSDYVLEYGELRFTFNERDFTERVEQAAAKLGFVAGPLGDHEREDLVNLAVNGEVPEPQSELGEHINFCWGDLNGPSERSLVHWIRRLVFRGAWLDQRVMEGELEVVFDEHTPLLRLRPARPQLRADRALPRAQLARGRVSPVGFSQPRCNFPEEERMRKLLAAALAVALIGLVAAPAASAKERLLTLYSPKIDSLPYVHDTHEVTLKADGVGAPEQPGYILGFKEMALVDSKNPNAKPLPIAKMMVHHFLYFAPGRVDQGAGSCWRGAGFIGGRGEEHPLGHPQMTLPKSARDKYGINNRKADGTAPDWSPDRDGDEPLQAAEELLRPHAGLVHDRDSARRSCRS